MNVYINYDNMASRWVRTKPIRGRSTDVRPIGERRRDWECIEREAIDEGIYAYHAVLHNTKCITYLPNGDVILRTNGWQTPSTAAFIDQWSPFTCYKRHNKLWVDVRTTADAHPSTSFTALPIGNELRLNYVMNNTVYRPATKVTIQKQVVNRDKAKAAREPIQPFLSWVKAFLTLSEGWVMHETRKEVLGWEKQERGAMHFPLHMFNDNRKMYKVLTEQMEIIPEDTYVRVLCTIAPYMAEEQRVAETHSFVNSNPSTPWTQTQRFDDYRLSFDAIKRKVYKWVEDYELIHDTIEVEAGRRAIHGTV
jgi:hypothetical protein